MNWVEQTYAVVTECGKLLECFSIKALPRNHLLILLFDPFAQHFQALDLHFRKIAQPPNTDIVERLRIQRVVLTFAFAFGSDYTTFLQYTQMP